MTANDYVLWFIATTAAVSALLAFGTLAAAGLLHRPHRRLDTSTAGDARSHRGEVHHHWYDRFHFHHAA